jgi:TPR repeat protein
MRYLIILALLLGLAVPTRAEAEYFEGLSAIMHGKYEKGLDIWREDAAKGDVGIQIILGSFLVGDPNIPPRYHDFDEGIMWLERAAARELRGQAALGSVYAEGTPGHPKDYAKAVHWLMEPAKHGDADAELLLGNIYTTGGAGISADPAKAVQWTRSSAEHGNDDAQFALAQRYETGNGVAPDLAEVVRWYQRAAEQGHPASLLIVGRLYRDGRGVNQSNVEAHFWLSLAAMRHAIGESRKPIAAERDAVAQALTQADLSASEQRVKKWRPTVETGGG